ncbi:MAG TPA: YsnF/AvaK domain-containing protein [Chitinophagaceae bacterium]|nr:YsnF/AvaK domain-containing protein [Chitinophagaceae bacterium]
MSIKTTRHKFSYLHEPMEEQSNSDQREIEKQQELNDLSSGFSQILPVIEEQIQIDKKLIETGKVHIAKKVSSHETSITIPLRQEEFDIERKPINQVVTTPPPPIRYEGDTMIIPVMREVMVIEKRYELLEEIRVTKRTSEKAEVQRVTLLKEDITINRSRIDEPLQPEK